MIVILRSFAMVTKKPHDSSKSCGFLLVISQVARLNRQRRDQLFVNRLCLRNKQSGALRV